MSEENQRRDFKDFFVTRRQMIAGATAGAATFLTGLNPSIAQVPRAREGRYLIKNGVVLSFDPKVGDFDKADVLIENGKILEVKPNIAANATILDASDMIVLPGFVDSHHHFYQSALRNILGNGLLADYFRDMVLKATPLYRVEDAYIGVLAGALRSLSSGITQITDLSQVSNSPGHSDTMIKAFKDSNIRAVYAYSRGYGEGAKYPDDVARLQKEHFASKDQLVTLALGTGVEKEQWLVARKHGLRIYTHVVGSLPTSTPALVMKLGDEGLMGADNVYIHFTGSTAEHMKRVKATGGAISMAVPIEMTMRHGMPPLQLALDAGIRPSLSSDVETTMAADIFSQMRSAFTLQRALVNERSIQGEKELPPLLSAKDIIAMATIEGARCNALESKTGSLTPGKDADIVMLRTNMTNVMPLNNAYGAVVTGMDTSNVDTVMVAGRIVKHKGLLTGVNIAAMQKRITASRDYIVEKAGWPKSVIDTSLPGH